MSLRWRAAALSDTGRVRRGNEDSFHLSTECGVFLVADGMGGHAAGEVASDIVARAAGNVLCDAVRNLSLPNESPSEPALRDAVEHAVAEAYGQLVAHVREQPQTAGMGTTLTACVVRETGHVVCGHIGDSRLYLIRDGSIRQLTPDHTWVQREVDEGRLPAHLAIRHPQSHILTRVLSEDTDPAPDIITSSIASGDMLLLCTDGLTAVLRDDMIEQILTSAHAPELSLEQRVQSLVDAANQAGGPDNITVIAIHIT